MVMPVHRSHVTHLAELCHAGVRGPACVLPVHGALTEEQVDLVIFRVVALGD